MIRPNFPHHLFVASTTDWTDAPWSECSDCAQRDRVNAEGTCADCVDASRMTQLRQYASEMEAYVDYLLAKQPPLPQINPPPSDYAAGFAEGASSLAARLQMRGLLTGPAKDHGPQAELTRALAIVRASRVHMPPVEPDTDPDAEGEAE